VSRESIYREIDRASSPPATWVDSFGSTQLDFRTYRDRERAA